MTTISQIIIDAFRESGIYAVDDTVSVDDAAEGLRRFNSMFSSLFAAELGEPFTTVNYGSQDLTNTYALDQDVSTEIDSAYVPSNTRVILNLETASTLYLNPNPMDGARVAIIDNAGNLATNPVTLNANGRQIEAADSVVVNTNSVKRAWFYRADTGNWVRVTDLVSADESPLPGDFDDMLIILLAIRLNPRHGAETSPESVEVLKRSRKIFRARYRQSSEKPVDNGLVFIPSLKKFRRNVFNA